MRRNLGLWLVLALLCLQIHSMEDPILQNEHASSSQFPNRRWLQYWVLDRLFPALTTTITRCIFSYLTWPPTTTHIGAHPFGLQTIAFSQDYSWCVSSPRGTQTLFLSDLTNGHRVRTFTAPEYLTACALPVSLRWVVGGGQRNLFVWHTYSGMLLATLSGHADAISACCVFFHDTRIASGSYDTTVRIWSIGPFLWTCLYVLGGHVQWISTCMVSADNALLLSMSGDSILIVWQIETGEIQQVLTDHTAISYRDSCRFSVDNNQCVGSISETGQIKLWDITTGKCSKTIPPISPAQLRPQLCFLSATRVVWWSERNVCVWNIQKNSPSLSFHACESTQSEFVSVPVDGKYILIMIRDVMFLDEATRPLWIQVRNFKTGNLIQ